MMMNKTTVTNCTLPNDPNVNMSPPLLTSAAAFCLYFLNAEAITFDPSHPQIVNNATEVQINCHHDDSDKNVMLWYKQLQDGQIKLIVYSYVGSDPVFEKDFLKGFAMRRTDRQTGALIISNVEPSDSAMYFCAASIRDLNEAYFGTGTKLTVLEKDHPKTPPKVTVLPPSENEGPRNRGDPKVKTLVCVANDFYPDHVTVSWRVNGEPRKQGVSTDDAPQKMNNNYAISSRLRVDAQEWSSSGNCFMCVVKYYDGSDHKDHDAQVCGIDRNVQDDEDGLTREAYLRITHNAKLSYVVLIVKGLVYGLFVAFLVWKIPRLNGKQT